MINNIRFIFLILILAAATSINAQNTGIIPKPVSTELHEGTFTIDNQTIIHINTDVQYSNAIFLRDMINAKYGFEPGIINGSIPQDKKMIFINTIKSPSIEDEGYYLSIEVNKISINARTEEGVFYGLQSLFQLMNENTDLPCLKIRDYPAFKWRGMHLDVSRHFFPKEFVKKYIDYLAMYKMNTFHWHLTDDQGWRIEIKKYPKLTEIGSHRSGTLIGSYRNFPQQFDTISYGGYYTQDDIREVVQYASSKHITIVPEIEMPGHALAALASYPELSCTGGHFEVSRTWGVFEDIFCPKEETFNFLEDVLTEVMELFPGKYIHIGGDEAPKDRWKNCAHCQALMKKEGLKNENELQSYFIRRIEKFVNSKGRSIIGWDEILEGGLAPNAAVMSWRGTEGGTEAAMQKHYVVMSPVGFCYFDYYQGDPRFEPLAIGGYIPIEKVYSYDPVPEKLTADEQKYILGAQANLWTEYIDSPQKVEYMMFPRICALAEVVWTPKESKNFDDFKSRLINHFSLLTKLGINYSKSIFDIKSRIVPDTVNHKIYYELTAPAAENKIYYSTNLDTTFKLYTDPVEISQTLIFRTENILPDGSKGKTIEQEFFVNKATGKKITLKKMPSEHYNTGGAYTLVDGIKGRLPWYGKEWLGFSGDDMEAVIDLGEINLINMVTAGVLNAENDWIYLPSAIEIYSSDDNINFKLQGKADKDEIIKQNREIRIPLNNIKARYIKVFIKNYGKIPAGKPGEGNGAWLFVDEIGIE